MEQATVSNDAEMTYSPRGSKVDLNAVIDQYHSLVSRIAWRVHSTMSSSIEVADLIQIGLIALLESTENFEDRGIDFAAYASLRVRGAMIDELRRIAKISRHGMQNKKRLNRAREDLRMNLGREPLAPEIAEKMNIDIEEYYQIESSSTAIKQENIDEVYSEHEMWFADLTQSPFDELEQASTTSRLASLLELLPERQRIALQLYFVEEANLEEIGAILGVGAARVCQIKKEALKTLRGLWEAN